MKFCKCGSLIIKKRNIKTGMYHDHCPICEETYDLSAPKLYIDMNIREDVSIEKIKGMVDDDIYQKIRQKCKNKKCDSNILKYDYNMKTMTRIYVCPKCKYYWV